MWRTSEPEKQSNENTDSEFADDENDVFFNDKPLLNLLPDRQQVDEVETQNDKNKKGKKEKKKKRVQVQIADDEEDVSGSDDEKQKKPEKSGKGLSADSDERMIKIAVPNHSYCSNIIKTNKYTLLNFFPLNLLEQIVDPINFYCIFLIILQIIPQISVSSSLPTLLIPLICSMILRGMKEGREDIHLANEAQEVNGRKTEIMRKDKLKVTTWDNLFPGDIIIIKDGEIVPADCLVLYSSNTYRECCYLDPRSLNGSQHLIRKDILKYPEKIDEDNPIDYCNYFVNSKVTYEKENPDYNSFKGKLELVDVSLPITVDNIVFRGAILKNTDYIYCVVLYTGLVYKK